MKNFVKFATSVVAFLLFLVTTSCHTGGGRIDYTPFPISIQFTDESSAGDGYVFLDWEDYPLKNTDFVSYILSRATSPDGPWTIIVEIPDRSEYQDTGVTNGRNYYYSVQVKTREGRISVRVVAGPFRPHSDTTPPAAPTNLQAGGGDRFVVLFWSSPGEDVVAFRIYRNTAPSVPTTPQYLLATVPAGVTNYNDTNVENRTSYWYVVTAVDAEGNESGPSNVATATPLPDTTPPETTILSTPPALSNSPDATFTFSSNETGSTFQCALDGSGFSACTSPTTYTGLSDGNHTFTVRATDPSGNVDPTPATYNWTIDTTPPETLVTGGPPPLTNQTSATFNLQSNESPVTFECSLNGSPFSTCPATVNYSGLAEGTYTFAARARDLAGNTDSTPSTRTWTVDTTPPVLTLTQTPSTYTNQTTATFDWSSSETTYECSLDGAAFASCPGKPAVYTGLSEGAHNFRVRGVDDAGNVGDPATYNWTVDTTPPNISNLEGPSPFTNSTVANFTWTITDNLSPIATVECRTEDVDPGFRACTTQTTDVVSGLVSGGHTWHVRATDVAGNQSVPLEWNWYVDITGPGVTVLSPNGGENFPVGQPITIQWVSLDTAQSGIAYHNVFGSPNGGANWYPIPECQNLPPNANSCVATPPENLGSITNQALIRVVATDFVGNTGEDVSDAVFSISDQTPPTVSVIAPGSGETILSFQTYTIQWTSSDNLGIGAHNLYLSLDGGTNFAPIPECTNLSGSAQSCNWDPPDVNNFNAVVRVCATDITNVPPAPNTGCGNSGVFTILFDSTPPEAPTITSGPAEGSATNEDSATFDFMANDPPPYPSGINHYECELDGSGFTTCTPPVMYSGLPDRAHTFRVRAVDNAGNVGPVTVRNWTTDTTPPINNVTAPNGGEFIAGNSVFNIAWTASDATSGLSPTPGSATVEYSIDNGANWNPAAGCETAASSDGSCNWIGPPENTQTALVRVTVRDLAGNQTMDTSDAVFTIDSTPPDTSIDYTSPPEWTNQTDAKFEFTGTDNFSAPENLTFECSLDSAPFTPCSSPQTYSGLAEGPHTFAVRAKDEAGNTDDTPPEYNWNIDLTPPGVQVIFPNAQGDYVRVPATNTITWKSDDGTGSGVDYFVVELSEDSGGNWTLLTFLPYNDACPAPPDCSYDWTITNPDLFNRTNLIRITAYDIVGNSAQDESDNNFSYAFYERHEKESDPATFELQHPNSAIRRWWNFGFGGGGATYTCPNGSLFRWFPAKDDIFGGFQENHSQDWFRWAVCQTGDTYFYPPAPNERIGPVAGPFPLTDATEAFVIMNLQWDLDPDDVLTFIVSSALPNESSPCNTPDPWNVFDVGFTGTSPDFGTTFVTAQIDLSTLPDPQDGPIIGSTRCFGLLLIDLDGDGSNDADTRNYAGPMMDDFTVVKF